MTKTLVKKYVANKTQLVIMIMQKFMKGRLSIGGTSIVTVGRLGMRCG